MTTTTAVDVAVAPVVSAKPNPVFRDLPSGFVISSEMFAKQKPEKQAEIIALSAGKPISFFSSFTELCNKRRLRDRALQGEDITIPLEFNGIDLSRDEFDALAAIRPVLEKLGALRNDYNWMPELSAEMQQSYKLSSTQILRSKGHSYGICTIGVAKRVWDAASKYWSDVTQKKPTLRGSFDGYDRQVTFHETGLDIGCQSFSRDEIEYVARHYGWAPNI